MNTNAMFDSGFFGLWFLFILSHFLGAGIQQALQKAAPRRLRTDDELPPCDVAYLSGGAERALLSALTALRVAELVTVDERSVRAIGRSRPDLDALQRAVLAATTAPVPRSLLARRPAVAAALTAIETRLIEEGLLLSGRRRLLIRLAGIVPLLVAVTVLVRTVFTAMETQSVFTGLFGVVAVVLAVHHVRRVPRRSRCGDRTLSKLRNRHTTLSPQRGSDSSNDDDVTGAALSVGIFGHEAVRTCDPGLADALCLPQTGDGGGVFGSSDSWGSSHSWGSSGGWDSDSSGGSGSSWGSGGSWGSDSSGGSSSSSSDSGSSS